VGGGFGGIAAARALRKASARVLLIDKTNHHVFQPLLYQVATSVLSRENIAAPIRHVRRRQANTTVLQGTITGAELFGYLPADAVGRPLDIIIPEHLRHAHWEVFGKAVASGHTKHGTRALKTRAIHKAGHKLYVSLAFSVVKDREAKVIGAMATARPFTEDKTQLPYYLAGQRSGRVAMDRQVTALHQDEEGHWVAELQCGHNQHNGQRTSGEAEKSKSDRIARVSSRSAWTTRWFYSSAKSRLVTQPPGTE
jgi:PAS domain S-box-containing protein